MWKPEGDRSAAQRNAEEAWDMRKLLAGRVLFLGFWIFVMFLEARGPSR